LSPTLVNTPIPSAFNVSSAYAASRTLASESSIGSTAKKPNRPGWSATTRAIYSFDDRASLTASSRSPSQTPGCVIDTIARRTPLSSIASRAFAIDHRSTTAGLTKRPTVALTKSGGSTWW
jgi:hypothetical protein